MPAFIVKPMLGRARDLRASARRADRRRTASPSGMLMSQISRADAVLRIAPREDAGTSTRSGASSMSDSSMRTNPSIDEPSNMMSPSSAFSNCDARDLDVLVDAEDVGELQPQEADVVLPGELENVLRRWRPSGRVAARGIAGTATMLAGDARVLSIAPRRAFGTSACPRAIRLPRLAGRTATHLSNEDDYEDLGDHVEESALRVTRTRRCRRPRS